MACYPLEFIISIPEAYYSLRFIISIPGIYYSLGFIISIILDHGQPWSNVTFWQWLSQYENQLWSTKVQHRFGTNIVSIWKSIMVNHGPMSHCDKDCLKHGQPWSNVTLWQRFSWFENQSWPSILNHGQPKVLL